MNNKRKLIFCTFLFFLIGFMVSCEIDDNKANIYKDNDKIAQENNNFSFEKRKCNEESNDKLDMEYDLFYGTNTIWVIQSEDNGEITFNYHSTVDKGDFKAVLVHPSKEVETVFEGTGENAKTIRLTQGKYFFRIVGKKAKGKLKISNSKNKNVNVREGRVF